MQKAGAFSSISGGQVIVSTPSCTGGALTSAISAAGAFLTCISRVCLYRT